MDLVDLIRRSIEEARAKGRDYLGQSEHAVRTVMKVRPDMTLSDALTAVNVIRSA
ncbi:MAG: hypothetical protein MI920_24470 [Kiloniellales bacterium]|nr:hypothetical protein [Kiloniellales bacterium]